jgi:hypothetical protein
VIRQTALKAVENGVAAFRYEQIRPNGLLEALKGAAGNLLTRE